MLLLSFRTQTPSTPTKIWILDHNFVYWGRGISELDDPDFRRYANSVAWHGYTGEPGMMSKVHAPIPKPKHSAEGSTDYNDPHHQNDWANWITLYTPVLNNWCRAATAWNVASWGGRKSRRPETAHSDEPRRRTDGSGQSGTEFGHRAPGGEFDRRAGLEMIELSGEREQGS
jgi:hypothetical protein